MMARQLVVPGASGTDSAIGAVVAADGAVGQPQTVWCIGRTAELYDELLLVTRPTRSTMSLASVTAIFRAKLDSSVESVVGVHGRRNFVMLPPEDRRCFLAGIDPCPCPSCVSLAHFPPLWLSSLKKDQKKGINCCAGSGKRFDYSGRPFVFRCG